MFMKNIDVLFMVNSGVLGITNYELSPKSAYKVLKFRNALQKALDNIQETEKSLLKDAEIENVEAFNKELSELSSKENKTPEENAKLKELESKNKRYGELRSEMLQSDVVLKDVLTIPYEDWHALRKENRPRDDKHPDPLNNYIENILENILWTAPKDE